MTGTVEDESSLIAGLRNGDERAYSQLVDRYSPAMLRVARGYVRSHQIAEEVVQETWIGVLKGIAKFEGRSSLRTWIFTVIINIAKTRGMHERRDSDAEIAAFYAQFGVDAKQFAGNMKSFAVTGKFNKAKQYIVSQRVNSTPTLMVNGKYGALGRSAEDRFRIVDALIAHELARTAAPATP